MISFKNIREEQISFEITKEQTLILKGIAIAAMLWHHLFACAPQTVIYSNGYITTSLGYLGKICVSLFLLLSGYGLAKQYSKYDIRVTRFFGSLLDTFKFLLRRFVKFYSNYWFVFIIFVPISVLCFNRPFSISYGENVSIFKHIVLDLMGVLWERSYNITWWFNSLIILMYVLFPFFFLLCRRYPFILFIATLLLVPYGDAVHIAYRGINRWLFPFCAGIIWGTHSVKITQWLNKFNSKILVAVFLLLTITFSFLRLYDLLPVLNRSNVDGLIALNISLLVTAVQRSNCLFNKFLPYLGMHSANIYMIHTFIYGRWFIDFIYWFNYPILIFIVLLTITLGLSVILELVKEKIGFKKAVNYAIDAIKISY